MKNKYFLFILSLLFIFISDDLYAHTTNYNLGSLSTTEIGWVYFEMGFTHILPLGFDHVLFVLGLFFFNPKLKSVIWQATAFTVAHSITLALAMNDFIHPVGSIIEPIIALSILFIAVENIFMKELKWWRIFIVFSFGLIHGCGFASVLTEMGLPPKNYLLALLTFNLGVEVGQIAVITGAWLLIGKYYSNQIWYRNRIAIPASCAIGCIALYWTIERAFFL